MKTFETGAKRDNPSDKLRLDLVEPEVEILLAQVMSYGAKKYGDYNWYNGFPYTAVLTCLRRHVLKFSLGEDIDQESGLPHIGFILSNTMMLARFMKLNPELDDRIKRPDLLEELNNSTKSKSSHGEFTTIEVHNEVELPTAKEYIISINKDYVKHTPLKHSEK